MAMIKNSIQNGLSEAINILININLMVGVPHKQTGMNVIVYLELISRLVQSIAKTGMNVIVYLELISRLVQSIANIYERHTAKEVVLENEGSSDVAAAFDGTWQKRGHTSMNGVATNLIY
ncbi:hypothetical protein PR048_007492 [Dryococelus australis]|uniref:Uncharacterized protein n=1 Tax=Dryococelus australis TaxID=614101 RepID=A0ABQ9HUT7_9NEOP|nr:hypothetical protein PR048_007492 [Dryococelus australis]